MKASPAIGASLALALLCACEAPGEKPAQESLAKVRVLRASGNKEAALTSARTLATGYPDTKAAKEATKIGDELAAELKAEQEKEAAKRKKESEEREARDARISAKIAASTELLAKLSAKTDEMAGVTWYKAKGDDLVLGTWIRFYFGIRKKGATPALMPLRLVAHLEDTDWVFAKKAVFKVDDKMYEVRDDEWNHSNYGGTVWERADVPLSAENPDLMRALVQGSTVKVRFEGRERARDVSISGKEMALLKQVFAVWNEISSAGDAK
jgi:hypothetical protein